jgi:hypothetical protein
MPVWPLVCVIEALSDSRDKKRVYPGIWCPAAGWGVGEEGRLCIDRKLHTTWLESPSFTSTHEPGATAVTDWLGIAFSTDWLSTDDLG